MNDLSRRTRTVRGANILWLGAALAALPAAMPASGSEGEVEYRQHVMSAVGGHMQAAADIARQKVPHQEHFALHVNGLVALSGIVHTLFPDTAEGGDALPAIWENPDDFAGKVTDFENAAAELKTAVDDGGDVGGAFQKVGQACKSCHDDYREE